MLNNRTRSRLTKTEAPMILVMVFEDDSVITDYNAELVAISSEEFAARTDIDIDYGSLVRAEGLVSGGRLMQPLPMAGRLIRRKTKTKHGGIFVFSFGGPSYNAEKYMNIKSPRENAGRKKTGKGKKNA